MISPCHGNLPPFELPSNVVYFHDWRYINPGSYRWVGPDGQKVPMFTLDPIPPMTYEYRDMPLGIRLEARKPERSEPILKPEHHNELSFATANLIHEDGRYRLWYETWPVEDFGKPVKVGGYNLLKYAESDDGTDWKFPALGVYEREGTTANNTVFGRSLSPVHGFHGGCVFRDPSAPAAERYKLFHLGGLPPDELEVYIRNRPEEVDHFHLYKNPVALFGGVSPDGFHWTHIPDPLILQTSDTHNVCEYDPVLQQYVAYCRSWLFNRRTIGRMATADFRRFPLPEELFWPGPAMSPCDTWYANGKTRMPGTTDYHVMFPMRWVLTEDSFDFYLATSPDNVVWSLVPGGPICAPGLPGQWDGGLVGPGLGLVELPGDRIGILVGGSSVPHKHPRRPPYGALGWAIWPKGRLVALTAAVDGSFALWPLRFKGRSVHLNCKTSLAGFIKVAAWDHEGKPLRSFDDCDVLSGDHLDGLVTWKGQSDLGHPDGTPVTLKLQLRSAELYSIAFR